MTSQRLGAVVHHQPVSECSTKNAKNELKSPVSMTFTMRTVSVLFELK